MDELKKAEIRNFLLQFKKIVVSGRGLDLINRRENLEALAKLGLTKKNLKEEIRLFLLKIIARGQNPTGIGLVTYGYSGNK